MNLQKEGVILSKRLDRRVFIHKELLVSARRCVLIIVGFATCNLFTKTNPTTVKNTRMYFYCSIEMNLMNASLPSGVRL